MNLSAKKESCKKFLHLSVGLFHRGVVVDFEDVPSSQVMPSISKAGPAVVSMVLTVAWQHPPFRN